MTDGITAEARLTRLLYILPAATRKEGVTLQELADALGTSKERIQQDIEEATARAYYHPGGWPDDVSILLDGDRVWVSHASGMNRPVRLSPRETLCLALGLRGSAAASHMADSAARTALLQRAEAHLGAGTWSETDGAPLQTEDAQADSTGIRETLLAAARGRHPCAIVYVKPGTKSMDVRVIHPYTLAHGEGMWYVVGLCTVKQEIRIFRVDRIVEAAETEGTFQVPDDFDAKAYLTPTRVYRAEGDVEVRVRYSPKIARWVRERAAAGMMGWDEESDGSVVIRHRVADPHWVVGHALHYGAEAEILEPEALRALVREVLAGMAG